MAESEDGTDLLIFRNRPEAERKPEQTPLTSPPVTAPAPSPSPVQVQQQRQPEQQVQQAQPAVQQQVFESRAPIPPPTRQFSTEKRKMHEFIVGGSLDEKQSIKLAKGQFCQNHPWRHAYAVCTICKLPYCYIDIMADHGKLYCLNDIDLAISPTATEGARPSINTFTVISSLIFLTNAGVLGYFMYPQATFIAEKAMAAGVLTFLFNISNTYYIPLGNMLLAVASFAAAITVLRKSVYGFGFSLFVSFTGLMLVLYEYLNTSVPYLFGSSALLLISLAALTYSKMSSSKEVIEDNPLAPEIEWPKPETF